MTPHATDTPWSRLSKPVLVKVVDDLAAGRTEAQVRRELPRLVRDTKLAALRAARERVDQQERRIMAALAAEVDARRAAIEEPQP